MKESQWPDQRFDDNLNASGIPKDKQDLFSLLELLPSHIFTNGHSYHLMFYRDPRWNACYTSPDGGGMLHLETGRTLADAVARLTVYLIERGYVKIDG